MYASWAAINGVDLKVYFGSNIGAVKYVDPNFGKEIKWNNLYLDKFIHTFLNGENQLPIDRNLDSMKLASELSDFNPDLLIHYGYSNKLSNRAFFWALKNKVKIGYISDSEFRHNPPLWRKVLKIPFLFFYFQRINYFFSVGDSNEDYYRFYGVRNSKIRRMHFSIDIDTFELAYNNREFLRDDFRSKFDIPNGDIVISVVGKLISGKNQGDLVRLLAQLEGSIRDVRFHLLIAGSGLLESELKSLADKLTVNKVHFLGFVNPSELTLVYLASDVYIHPSKRDAHPLTVSEAVYMGCPVIVSNTTGSWGPNDDVQAGKNGFVYECTNIDQLEMMISRIIDEDLFEQFSCHSRTIGKVFQNISHQQMIMNLVR